MSSYQQNFQRKETKYRLDAAQYAHVVSGLAAHMEVDQYGKSGIDSLYYDTPTRALIERSMEKPLYKEKLRVRTYGADEGADVAYVELKKKMAGVVYKRRVQMSRAGAQAFLGGAGYEDAQARYPLAGDEARRKVMAPTQVQIAHEIEAFLARHDDVAPSMVISVARTAWRALDEADAACGLRVTFDEDVYYEDLFAGKRGYKQSAPATGRVISRGEVLMEVKCMGAYPLWLVRLLDACAAYPSPLSKYGEAYKICLGSAARAMSLDRARPAPRAPRPARSHTFDGVMAERKAACA